MRRTAFPLFFLVLVAIGALYAYAPASRAEGGGQADTARHEPFIQKCFELSRDAARKGNHPFGALLVHQGKIISQAENTVTTGNDVSRHAEINLITAARRDFPMQVLRESTLYTSASPCPLCVAAMLASGITRVVSGVSYASLSKVFGLPDESLPITLFYQIKGQPLEFTTPVLEREGLEVFGLWPEGDRHAAAIRKKVRELK